MKNEEDIKRDRLLKIELNDLKVIEYIRVLDSRHDKVKCVCVKCGYLIEDSHINLSKKKYKCRYCTLIKKSKLIRDGVVEIIKIDEYGEGAFIHLKCNNGHVYKQDRRNLLANKGCNKCYLENKSFTKKDVICEFNRVHGDYYNYNFDRYKNLHSKIEISCRKGHIFHQKVSNHIQGKGCPICRESLGERTISNYLKSKSIEYIRQKKYDDCVFINKLPFDFFIPKFNLIIEYDGIQHFIPIKQFGGEHEFSKTKIKDNIKNQYCINNNINIVRISYKDNILDKLSNSIQKYIIF